MNSFSPKGKLALMFLKHYTCCSDKRLIEQLKANIDYQFFCDLHLGHHRLTNYKKQTNFKSKGNSSKDHKEQQELKGMITKKRASRLYGSFVKKGTLSHQENKSNN